MKGVSFWLDTAVAGIRFFPDQEAVKDELAAHLEDKAAGLRRIFPDMSEEEAQAWVLAEMGDPEALGKALAQVHRPWPGYLWALSRVLLGLALAVLCGELLLTAGMLWTVFWTL